MRTRGRRTWVGECSDDKDLRPARVDTKSFAASAAPRAARSAAGAEPSRAESPGSLTRIPDSWEPRAIYKRWSSATSASRARRAWRSRAIRRPWNGSAMASGFRTPTWSRAFAPRSLCRRGPTRSRPACPKPSPSSRASPSGGVGARTALGNRSVRGSARVGESPFGDHEARQAAVSSRGEVRGGRIGEPVGHAGEPAPRLLSSVGAARFRPLPKSDLHHRAPAQELRANLARTLPVRCPSSSLLTSSKNAPSSANQRPPRLSRRARTRNSIWQRSSHAPPRARPLHLGRPRRLDDSKETSTRKGRLGQPSDPGRQGWDSHPTGPS